MTVPEREQADQHGLNRVGIDRDGTGPAQPELCPADPVGFIVPALAAIGGLSTGRGLSRWPELTEDADPLGGAPIPGRLIEVLRRRAGAGHPVPEELRRAGTEALGQDLSQVRVHTDAEAGQLADSVQARAFSYGRDIYFAAGGYRPGDEAGRRLIAHELGHVGQHGDCAAGVIGRADDPAEARADRAAAGIVGALRRQAQDVAAVHRSAAPESPAAGMLTPLGTSIRRARTKPPRKKKRKHPAPAPAAHVPAPAPAAHVPAPVPAAHVPAPVPAAHVPAPVPAAHVPAPAVAPGAPRTYQSIPPGAPPAVLPAGHIPWWTPPPGAAPAAAPAVPAVAGQLPAPRSFAREEPQERPAGSFTAIRRWDTMPGQGFIVQHIRRTFGQISIYDPATRRWKQANGAKLRRYMRTKFPQLHYRIKDYWEIFPVDATGTAPDGDMFQMIAFAPPRTRDYLNTSRGTFTQTGTAYFVPSNEAEDVFAQRFGMRKKAIAPANRLYARRGPYDFPGEAGHQGLAVSPVPSVFTLRATWNTDRARNDPSTSTTITET